MKPVQKNSGLHALRRLAVGVVAAAGSLMLVAPLAHAAPADDARGAIDKAAAAVADGSADQGFRNTGLGEKEGDVTSVGDGFEQKYAGGAIYWSDKTGAQVLYGAINDKFVEEQGPTGSLGFPTKSEGVAPAPEGARYAEFAAEDHPKIYWTPQTGAWVVRGPFAAALADPQIAGALGVPVGAAEVNGDIISQKFANGTLALDRVDLAIEQGSFVSLLGPSGCGKSTLLRLIAGFNEAQRGTVLIDGEDVPGVLRKMVGPALDGDFDGYRFALEGIERTQGPNYLALTATMRVTRDGHTVALLHPQRRHYTTTRMPMTEVALDRGVWRDLYVALGEPIVNGNAASSDAPTFSVRIHHKPLVNWIWGGCLLMALGGLLGSVAAISLQHSMTRQQLRRFLTSSFLTSSVRAQCLRTTLHTSQRTRHSQALVTRTQSPRTSQASLLQRSSSALTVQI